MTDEKPIEEVENEEPKIARKPLSYQDMKRAIKRMEKQLRYRPVQPVKSTPKVQRNEPCPCGKLDENNKVRKYKNCCGR